MFPTGISRAGIDDRLSARGYGRIARHSGAPMAKHNLLLAEIISEAFGSTDFREGAGSFPARETPGREGQ